MRLGCCGWLWPQKSPAQETCASGAPIIQPSACAHAQPGPGKCLTSSDGVCQKAMQLACDASKNCAMSCAAVTTAAQGVRLGQGQDHARRHVMAATKLVRGSPKLRAGTRVGKNWPALSSRCLQLARLSLSCLAAAAQEPAHPPVLRLMLPARHTEHGAGPHQRQDQRLVPCHARSPGKHLMGSTALRLYCKPVGITADAALNS